MAAKSLVISVAVAPVVLLAGIGVTAVAAAPPGQGQHTGLVRGTVPAAYAPLIERFGHQCKELTPGRLAAQLYQESGFNRTSVSHAGAVGIAQFMPGTWTTNGLDANRDGRADPYDPVDAIPAAARYDCKIARELARARVPGDPVNNMLAAYNAGSSRVVAARGVPKIAETQNYVASIRRLERTFTTSGGTVAPSAAAAVAIRFARSRLGTPYLWGGTGTPEQNGRFDCSGLMQVAYQQAGINLPRTSREQWYAGPHVPRNQLQPGDLVFFAWNTENPGSIHHVGMYVGGGWMIHAPFTGAAIRFNRIDKPDYIGAVRPTARA